MPSSDLRRGLRKVRRRKTVLKVMTKWCYRISVAMRIQMRVKRKKRKLLQLIVHRRSDNVKNPLMKAGRVPAGTAGRGRAETPPIPPMSKVKKRRKRVRKRRSRLMERNALEVVPMSRRTRKRTRRRKRKRRRRKKSG